jgi:hypothetical protein
MRVVEFDGCHDLYYQSLTRDYNQGQGSVLSWEGRVVSSYDCYSSMVEMRSDNQDDDDDTEMMMISSMKI